MNATSGKGKFAGLLESKRNGGIVNGLPAASIRKVKVGSVTTTFVGVRLPRKRSRMPRSTSMRPISAQTGSDFAGPSAKVKPIRPPEWIPMCQPRKATRPPWTARIRLTMILGTTQRPTLQQTAATKSAVIARARPRFRQRDRTRTFAIDAVPGRRRISLDYPSAATRPIPSVVFADRDDFSVEKDRSHRIGSNRIGSREPLDARFKHSSCKNSGRDDRRRHRIHANPAERTDFLES